MAGKPIQVSPSLSLDQGLANYSPCVDFDPAHKYRLVHSHHRFLVPTVVVTVESLWQKR